MPIKNIVFAVIGLIVLVQILVFLRVLPGRNPPTPTSVQLSFWGTDDDQEVWRDIIKNFQEKFPYITVKYTRFDSNDYEDTLGNKIAEAKGPDIFMLPNTFLLKHRDIIYPLPQQALPFSPQEFSSSFVDGAYQQLVAPDGAIYGLPLFIDTPVLFYNKDILNAAGIAQVPANWDDLIALSRQLTQKNAIGEIVKSGLPLGTSRTVDNSFEILSTLMLQEGDPIINRDLEPGVVLGEGGAKAMAFYTSFAKSSDQNFSWSNRMPNSLTAFSQTTSAFAIGFSNDIARIRAKNPHLNFGIAPFPQKKGTGIPVVYGRYFFPTVLKFSKNPLAAWQFVNYLTGPEGSAAYIQKTMRPPARRDLLSSKAPIPDLDAFYRQSLIAKSWPVPDNSATRQLFQDAIDSVISGTADAGKAVDTIHQRLDLLLPR